FRLDESVEIDLIPVIDVGLEVVGAELPLLSPRGGGRHETGVHGRVDGRLVRFEAARADLGHSRAKMAGNKDRIPVRHHPEPHTLQAQAPVWEGLGKGMGTFEPQPLLGYFRDLDDHVRLRLTLDRTSRFPGNRASVRAALPACQPERPTDTLGHVMGTRGDPYTTGAVHTVYLGDNLDVLRRHVPDAAAALVYLDPPFNTGRAQEHTRIKTVRSASGDRVGFKGHRYGTVKMGSRAYPDRFDDYLAFLEPRLREAYRALAPHGTLYFHIDYREVHYCKVLLDSIFGRECFLNE